MVRFISCLMVLFCFLAQADTEPLAAVSKEANQAAQATQATQAAHTAHHGASSAAQAIAASQQAAMMYQMLLAKGVMDFFQRKEMEKANEVLAKKMERLQQELQAGKLSSAQYAAIKAAVEDTYAKYSKIELPKDKEVAPLASSQDKSFKPSFSDSSSGAFAASKEDGSKTKLDSQSSDIVQLDSNQTGLKMQGSQDSGKNETSKSLPEKNDFVLPGGPGLLGQGLPLAPAVQPSLAQTIAVQNPSNEESGLGNQNSGFQTSRDLASPEFRESRFETALGDEEAWASEDGAIQDLGQYEREHSQSLLASNQPALRPQFGSGLRKFLKPIRFQKSPFSTRLQTEEGLHLGFLVLVLALAFVLGRKLHTSKKLPRVIPEIVLSSEKQSRGQSLAVRRRPRQG